MTKNKARKLIQELIEKYGDVVVAKKYDYWASKTYVKEGEDTNTIISEVHLSEIKLPINRSDFKELVNIVTGKSGINYIPVEIQESKTLYESPEQVEYRKIAAKNAKNRINKYTKYIEYILPSNRMFIA